MENISVTTDMSLENKKVSLYLHDDVAFSILSKLPLKSLKRFTCACQSWSRLFETPNFMTMFGKSFISAHRSLYNDTCVLLKQKKKVLCLLSGETNINLELPIPIQDNVYLDIFGSSVNGLFCVHHMFKRTYALWNPATQEFKIIPFSTVGTLQDKTIIPVSMIQGFGYDRAGDDYKIICSVGFIQPIPRGEDWTSLWLPHFLWEIFSLKHNSWKELDVNMPKSTHLIGSKVYLNGACHWCGATTYFEESVVSFNLSTEVFLTTPFPLYVTESFDFEWVHVLVVLNGFIALISKCEKITHFHISVLGEFGIKESWAKLFTIAPISCVYAPIGVGKKGEVFFRNIYGELICFDLSTGMIEESNDKGESFRCELVIYKKNLLSIGE